MTGRDPTGQALAVPATPASAVDGPTGFDPSRISIKVAGETLGPAALRAGIAAMKPGKGIDYFEAWDVVSALLPACRRRKLNASYVADRLMQRARKAGYIRHRGRGQWERTAIATETQRAETGNTDSVEDEGAGRQALPKGQRA